jgi:hypothetical protein
MHNLVTVIGTRHSDTKVYKTADLYDKFCNIKPDIILFEAPIEVAPIMMDWIKGCIKHHKGGEGTAILKYLDNHDAQVLPFDIKGRNDYFLKTDYWKQELLFERAYKDYFKRDKSNPSAMFYYSLFRKARRHQNKWDKFSINEFNSPECDVTTEAFLKLHVIAMSSICDLVPELTLYKSNFLQRERYEMKRDKAMVKNILDYNKQFEGKTIVVICGYFHRYAIINGLKNKQKSDTFTLNF